MSDEIVTCPHCGDKLLFDNQKCGCEGAKRDRLREAAKLNIYLLFSTPAEADGVPLATDRQIEFLNQASSLVIDEEAGGITVQFQNGTRARITRSAKGGSKIERVDTRKQSMEG